MENLNDLVNDPNLGFDPLPEPEPIPDSEPTPDPGLIPDPIQDPEPIPEPGPTPDPLDISPKIVDNVIKKGEDIPKDDNQNEIPDDEVGRKCCPTRHGCQGATDCDYAYGNYPF